MTGPRPHILVLSDIFPDPTRPASGIFVERQTAHVQTYCNHTVVVPTRVFPNRRIWQDGFSPVKFLKSAQAWRRDLSQIPARSEHYGYPVYYPRYAATPHQFIHGLWGFFVYAAILPLLRRLHRERPFELVHAHYATPAGVAALLARRWMRVPVIISIHGADVTVTARQNRVSRSITRWALRHADAVIVNSNWTMRQVQRYAGPVRPVIVYLGGDQPAGLCKPGTDARVADPAAPQTITLLTIGYLIKRKGQAYVVRAVRKLLDQGYQIRYLIIGDGVQRAELEQLIHDLGLQQAVQITGTVPHDQVWPYFAACDIFVLPSWDEAFGIVYIEALGLGKPVIGCAGEGGPEDLRALGDCVELVRPQDVDSLVVALKRLIDDPERRRALGALGRRIVYEHFTWERNALDTVSLYRKLLNRP
jgi:teichuronic acid biosynthesis glycosyltransferase TuaC